MKKDSLSFLFTSLVIIAGVIAAFIEPAPSTAKASAPKSMAVMANAVLPSTAASE